MDYLKANIKTQLLVMFCTFVVVMGILGIPTIAKAADVSKIVIDTTKTTVRYEVGSTISLSDIYIFVNGATTSSQCSTLSSATIDLSKNSAVGRKTVTLSYGGQTTTYKVVVAPKTPGVYTIKKLDFDKVRVYSTVQSSVSGCQFAYKLKGTTSYHSMGLTKTKTDSKRYYDSKSLLKPGSTYYYKVRTYVDVKGERFYSNWSSVKAYALPKLYGVDRWRPETKKQLLAHGVYSKTRENIIINIIKHESGGNEKAGQGRACVGLLQFNSGWTHNYGKSYFVKHGISNYQKDNRLSGSWSLHRVAMVIRDGGGTAALKRYWPTTWNAK